MPETLQHSEVASGTDPSVSKQYDMDVSFDDKFKDFYAIADKNKIGLLGIFRPGVGPVHRSMAVAKRTGPDFLFLANRDSRKFQDLQASEAPTNKDRPMQVPATVTFQNSSTQDWISVTGDAVTFRNDDPRIKEVWSKGVSAWFGDLKDGKHDGGPDDPRMALIEIQAKYVTYWKHEVGSLGFIKEVAGAVLTGGVANTGVLREMSEDEISQARRQHSGMTS